VAVDFETVKHQVEEYAKDVREVFPVERVVII
jgi:hypothetical protein